jgi:hypothetical protein
LLPFDVDDNFIKKFNPKGIILSGGPDTVTQNNSARAPQIVFDLNVPILGKNKDFITVNICHNGVIYKFISRSSHFNENFRLLPY